MRHPSPLTALALLSLGSSAVAQTPQQYRVGRVSEAVHVDASLRESAWRTADSIVDLRQREPLEGAPASERTVVKVLRDADRLFIAVRAYDRDMAAVRASQL